MLAPTYVILKEIDDELKIVFYTTDIDFMEGFISENNECFVYQSNDIINNFNHPDFRKSLKYTR
jgi:hypothetical protein